MPLRRFALLAACVLGLARASAAPRPNVLLIMPDDLSFGDFSRYAPGGPRTPRIDRLAAESLRFTDFHVSPTCSPTRAALMTGRYNDATGVWHTIKGREWLRGDEITMADVFRANGYSTALIGKWHLGDAYPLRPFDRGFEYTAMIRGGGISQQPDYWGDNNVPPTKLFVNDQLVTLRDEHDGIPGAYSTNFFTDRAIETLRREGAAGRPFFVYLAYNVAHDPADLPPDARPGVSAHQGTVENLDKNVGRILDFLAQSGLDQNTLLIFLTDNGEPNPLYRAGKSSNYEGGHRVPCYVRWPAGHIGGAAARDEDRLSSHIDVLPTLMDVCGFHDVANRPAEVPIQGRSLKTLLDSDPADDDRGLWTRTLAVDNQRRDHLEKYRQFSVMRDETDAAGVVRHKWRLVGDGAMEKAELYDVAADPKQTTNLSGRPGTDSVRASLRDAYEAWWQVVAARGGVYARVTLGAPEQPRVCLFSHDWHNDSTDWGGTPWNQGMIAAGVNLNGFEAVDFAQAGAYRFELRRWPEEIAGETSLGSKLVSPVLHGFKNGDQPTTGVALPIRSARLKIWRGDAVLADLRQPADPAAPSVNFTVPAITPGPAMVQTWFYDGSGKELGGAYYTYVQRALPAALAERPNLVYILADDLGYGDLGCYNAGSKIPTPRLDTLAREGLRFTDAHAPDSICTPSRYGILTGQYAFHTRLKAGVLVPWDPPLIEEGRLTVPEFLRQAGYATQAIGKWHLGWTWPTKDGQPPLSKDGVGNIDFARPVTDGPTARGFDHFFGVDLPNYPPYAFIADDHTVGIPSVPAVMKKGGFNRPGPMVPGWDLSAIMPEITRHAVKYVEDAGARKDGRPFFLYFALTAPHYPIVPTPEFNGKSQAGAYGDYVTEVDATVGAVLDALRRTGQADNTLVIFSSDNGPEVLQPEANAYVRLQKFGHSSMGDWRGAKRDVWEGGHRVPFVARWPGHVPAGQVSGTTIDEAGLLATCSELTGMALPTGAGEDSVSYLSVLLGRSTEPAAAAFVLHSGDGKLGVRSGNWVFIDAPSGNGNHPAGMEPEWYRKARGYAADDAPGVLYDLSMDPAERRNLYNEKPDQVRRLKQLLEELKARGPTAPAAGNSVPTE